MNDNSWPMTILFVILMVIIGLFSCIIRLDIRKAQESIDAQTILINAQTTLIKNVSEQLSEIRSESLTIANPEGWPESEDNNVDR